MRVQKIGLWWAIAWQRWRQTRKDRDPLETAVVNGMLYKRQNIEQKKK